MEKWSKFVAFLSLFLRGQRNTFGIQKYPKPGENIEARASQYLTRLNSDEASLAFKIALEDLRTEYDLLFEEAALAPKGLELHRKVIELANRYEIANDIVRDSFIATPIGLVITVILAEAHAKATKIQLDFEGDGQSIIGRIHTKGDWEVNMEIPRALAPPLRGAIARMEAIGFAALGPHMNHDKPLPNDVEFFWLNPECVEITTSG